MRRFLRILGIIVLIAFGAIQTVRPARTNPTVDPARTLQAVTTVPPAAGAILQRSCRDCHTNETVWPWYTNIAPLSWFITDHVNEGREHLNFSEWGHYSQEEQRHRLEDICEEVEEGEMPLKSYLPAHPSARLSSADKTALCEWTDQLRGSGRGRRGRS